MPPPSGRREFEHEICAIPLEYAPRTQSIYSDLGFILLGFLASDLGGAPLDELFHRIAVRLKADTTDTGCVGHLSRSVSRRRSARSPRRRGR